MILRAEKGFIVVGKDTDGTTMPHDLGVIGPRDSRKDEYIGKRSLFMPVAADPSRKQLVGLSVASGEAPLPTGAHVTIGAGRARRSQGYVTSSYFSPSLGRPIALGLVEAGLSRIGETVERLSSRRRAARDHREPGRARSGRNSGSMREMEWPPARGDAGLLIDRPRLTARRLGGLGQTLISGDLDAAIAGLAPGAPMLGLYALAPESAHALRIGRTSALLVTPAPVSVADGWRDGWCATSVDDAWAAVEVSGEDAAASAHAGDLGRPRLGFALGRRSCLRPARPARADALRLPRPCRAAVAGNAARLARRGRDRSVSLSFPTAAQRADRESRTIR